jgi:hypothetical protein
MQNKASGFRHLLSPGHAVDCKRRRDGRIHIDFIVGHEANQHGRHRHVERPANKQGEADAQRKVALGFLHLAKSETGAQM